MTQPVKVGLKYGDSTMTIGDEDTKAVGGRKITMAATDNNDKAKDSVTDGSNDSATAGSSSKDALRGNLIANVMAEDDRRDKKRKPVTNKFIASSDASVDDDKIVEAEDDFVFDILQHMSDERVVLIHFASCTCWKCDRVKSALEKCTLCKQAYYCNATCREAHWPIHQFFCRPISSEKTHSEADGYTQFEETHKHKNVYVLECEQCRGGAFCDNTDSDCPKAKVWQDICTDIGCPTMLKLLAPYHRSYKDKVALDDQERIVLKELLNFCGEKSALLKYEDHWLLETFLRISQEDPCDNTRKRVRDIHFYANPLSDDWTPNVHKYFGPDDDDIARLVITTGIAHCILHTTSRQLAKKYQPNHDPEIVIKLVRFLERILSDDGITIQSTSDFLLWPEDIFLIYLAKKRARVLLEEQENQKVAKHTAKKPRKAGNNPSTDEPVQAV